MIVPIYLDVIETIERCDQYNEAMLHLRAYSKAYSMYQLMRELEERHNNLIQHNFIQIISRLFGEIEKNAKIKIKERSKSSETSRYYETTILNYFKLHTSNTYLELEHNYTINGKNYSRIRILPDNSDIAIGDRSSIDSLHKLIVDEEKNLLPRFDIIQRNIDDMSVRCEHFKHYVDNIIHDTDRCKLRGRCVYENRNFPYNIRLFFALFKRSKRY